MFAALKKLSWFFKQEKKRYIIAILILTVASVLEIIPPRLIGFVVDDVHQGRMTEERLFGFVSFFIVLMLVVYVMTYVWMRKLFGGSLLLERTMRSRLMNHLMTMTPSFYNRNKTGDLMAKGTNDLKAISQTAGFGILTLVDATVFLVVILVMMTVFISWELTLAAFLPFPLMAYLMKVYGKRIHERFMAAQRAFGDLNDQVLESISGVRVIRAFVKEQADRTSFSKQTDHVLRQNIRVARVDALFEPTIKILVGMSYMIGLGFGAYLVFQGRITLGQLVTFNIYLGMLIWPMFALGELMNIMQRGNASLDRLNHTFEAEPDVKDPDKPLRDLVPNEIVFDGLNFSYPKAKEPALSDVSVTIRKGMHIGVAGKTGSGKSTFLRQLLRAYPLHKGALKVNSVPFEQVSLSTVKGWIGYVPQESFLFSKSIEANIRFGAGDKVSDDRLRQVMEQAAITKDLHTFQDGLETLVGEKGISLSGGQKQRIAIARALMKDPEILILDDAMSAVDAKTEQFIISNIREERSGKTTFIAAHRMSAISHADVILVFDGGRIVEQGTHDELMQNGAWYKEQFDKQQMEQQSQEQARQGVSS
ncbi:ABC transporter ATP-binding protein [Salisediminibacterium selenitireducens]|uniref:ABC transporter related protein n=1 Tax=Bacillus selenitireducens (strain ATCC 700615 / DSM 15326 / MLS10) TaxID=439292 RepID=D6XWQ8_BACIE|nr:ABC transporter transmembrane domain-containing protein [Salisediminibacterium selenitireducens]ADH97900.1 ABC transporter related protein [[Bacillus] selenitireducens MLS10]